VRLLVDRLGACQVEAHALEETRGPVTVALADSPVDSSDEFLRHKTSERQVYQRHAPPPGQFDTLLWNERGCLTEFTRGNLVVELDGRRLTPPLSDGLLAGVLRAELLARGEIAEASLSRADLDRATGLWFINSLRGQLPVRLAMKGDEAAA
jgi:para-aminobenzoate synthetase/4-amino-4-deoxychorismate lyase